MRQLKTAQVIVADLLTLFIQEFCKSAVVRGGKLRKNTFLTFLVLDMYSFIVQKKSWVQKSGSLTQR